MTSFEMYEAVFNKLQERYDNGELTEEQVDLLNDAAYAKYVEEGCKKEEADDSEGEDAPEEEPEENKEESDDDKEIEKDDLVKKIKEKAKAGEITDKEEEMFLAIIDEAE